MDLGSSLSIATSGLNAIEYELSVTSQNVSNSGTTGYVSATANVSSAVAAGQGTGIKIDATTLNISPTLQKALYSQNAQVASLTTVSYTHLTLPTKA